MKITITEANGEYYARVNDGDLIVYVTAEYLTETMAMADARCWVAFHGSNGAAEMVWVPVAGGEEIEMPYGDAMKIALAYSEIQGLKRNWQQYEAHAALKELREWAGSKYGITSRDMAQVTRWWDTVDAEARRERAKEMVRKIASLRN